MALKSIRWRLPLSYAGIALFSVLALGLVLISILRGYYNQQEQVYLRGNAQEIASILAQEVNSNSPDSTIKNQISSWSFLLQARLQYIDKNGNVIADSGIPDVQQQLVVSSLPDQGMTVSAVNVGNLANNSRVITNSKVVLPGWGIFVLKNGGETAPVPQVDCPQPSPQPGQVAVAPCQAVGAQLQSPGGAGGVGDNNPVVQGTPTTLATGKMGVAITTSNTIFGFNLNAGADTSGQRSASRIVASIRDASGNPVGTIILSDGLAFGDEILRGVTLGWLLSSLIAVLLAACAGWWVSRHMIAPLMTLTVATASMAGGDLSARVAVQSRDEFGELGRSFNGMAERVEELVGTLRGFVADAAHQLMTPLTALRTNLELAADETSAEQRSAYLSRASAQMARMEALVSGLLELSRLEANGFVLSEEKFDLTHLAHEVAEIAASLVEQTRLQLILDLPEAPLEMSGDETRIRHVLENLLDNALKYTPAGGKVWLRLSKEEHGLFVAVEDTGGILPEDLTHVFERFHRGHNSAGIPGSGLGLAIVKAIVEMHQGQVSIANTEQGARVELRFPDNPGASDLITK